MSFAPLLPRGCSLDELVDRLDAPRTSTCTPCHGTGHVPCDCVGDGTCDHEWKTGARAVRCDTCDGYGDLTVRAQAEADEAWPLLPPVVRRAVLGVAAYTAANDPVVLGLVHDDDAVAHAHVAITLAATEAQRAELTRAGFAVAAMPAHARGVWVFVWTATKGGA